MILGNLGLDVRKRFFTKRALGHCNRLSREAVTAPSVTEFKKCLVNILRVWFGFWVVLCGARRWTLILVGPFQVRGGLF